MRRTLFSLLILLTALRGMVGDVMAYGMTQQAMQNQNAIAIESIAQQIDSMPASGHFSAEKAVSMPCHETADEASVETAANSCSTCQVCHLAVSLPNAGLGIATDAPLRELQIARNSIWHSAELHRASKPPIL
jgi:hypothetical protein